MSEPKPPEQGMLASSQVAADAERQVESLVERFLEQLRAGQNPDRQATVAAHPEIAAVLDQRLALVEMMYRVAQAAQPAARQSPTGPVERALLLKCPHCGNRIQLVQPEPREVTCQNCGSSFQVEPGVTADYRPEELPKAIGKFEVLELLGRGAFGAVYKARDPELNRLVAVKVPRAGYFASHEEAERFLREARSAAHLSHPSIVAVHEIARERGLPYIVSDFIEGLTLADLLSGGRPGFRESAELVAQVADALEYAHRQKIIHRDIKPGNILIDRAGRPHLTDFGLARREEGEITVTLEGQILGTPAYMAPEQAAGEQHKVDARSDVYSLGVVLYELVTGELPFRGTKRMLLHQVLHDEPRPPRKLNDRIPRDLETICLKALAKEPSRRYATAAALADDLRRFLNGEPIRARPVGKAERLVRWCRRNRAVASLLAAVVLVTLVGFGLVTWKWREAFFAQQETETALGQVTQAQQATEIALGDVTKSQQDTQKALGEVQQEKNRALASQRLAQDRLVQVQVGNGLRLMEEGDLFGALPWFVKALEEEKGGPQRQEIHRVRIAAILRYSPRLVQIQKRVEFSADRRRMFTVTPDNTAQAWDLATGQPVTPPFKSDKEVSHVGFSPDGRRIVTTSGKKVWLWDATTGKPVLEPLELDGDVLTTSFSGDSRRLLLSAANGLWLSDLANGRAFLLPLKDLPQPAGGAEFSPDGSRILTLSVLGNSIRVWDAASGKPTTPLLQHPGIVWCAAFSPDSRHIVTGCNDIQSHTVHVWDAATGQPVFGGQHGIGVLHVEYSPDSRRFLSASKNLTAQVWDAATGQPIGSPLKHNSEVQRAVFSPDGTRVGTASSDQTARVWDATTGQPITPPLQHHGKVDDVAFSPDGRLVITTSEDQTARVWDAASGEPACPPFKHNEKRGSAAFSPDGSRIITAGGAGKRVWDATGEQPESLLPLHSGDPLFSPDGTWFLAISSQDPKQTPQMRVWESATGKPASPPVKHNPAMTPFALSSDGRRAAMVSWDDQKQVAETQVWEAATGKPLSPAISQKQRVLHVAFSHDGSRLVTSTGTTEQLQKPGEARVWDAVTGLPISPPLKHSTAVRHAVFSPDDLRVATAGYDETARVWDVTSGRPLTPPLQHRDDAGTGAARIQAIGGLHHPEDVRDVVFSPDGRRLLTVPRGFETGQAILWDVANGLRLTPPLKHSQSIQRAAFSPDGRRVVTASTDQTARIWDSTTGQALSPPLNHNKEVVNALFSPDGSLLVTADDTMMRVWDAATGQALTPPLHYRGSLNRLAFSPDSRRLITYTTTWHEPSGVARARENLGRRNIRLSLDRTVWELQGDKRPVADLVLLTRLITEHQLDATGGLVPVPGETLQNIWHTLSEKYAQDFSLPSQKVLAWHRRETERGAQASQWFAALFHLDRLLEAEPANWALWLRRGQLHGDSGEWDKAAADFTKALELKTDAWDAWRHFGWVHQAMAKHQEAIADYTKAVGLNADDSWTWQARGSVYAELEQWTKAAADFARTMDLGTDDPRVPVYHAIALAGAADAAGYRKARAAVLEKYRNQEGFAALEGPYLLGIRQAGPGTSALWAVLILPADGIDPAEVANMAEVTVILAKTPASLNTFGAALYRAGRFEESIQKLNESIKASGSEGSIHDWLFLAMAHHRLGHATEAHQWLNKAMEAIASVTQKKPKERDDTRMLAWHQRLQLQLLRREAEAVLKLTPGELREQEKVAKKFSEGLAALEVGNHDKAIASFTEVIKLDPKHEQAYTHRGAAYNAKKDYDSAIADFSKAIELAPKNAEAYRERGLAYWWKGNLEQALADYTKAIELSPKDAEAYRYRGEINLQRNEYERAIADFDQAIQLDPKNVEALCGRGYAHWRMKKYEAATADFDKAIQVDPKSPDGYGQSAWMLSTCPEAKVRNGKQAVERATKACELILWKNGFYLDILAAAYAEAGNFDEAIKWQNKALESSGDFTQEGLHEARLRLKLYQKGKPYRDE